MITAGIYGLIGGAALFIGVLIGLYMKVSKRVVGSVMAFGSGVLISALTFDLMEKAYQLGGFDSVSIGFIAGAVMFVGGDYVIDRYGGHFRKRVHGTQHAAKKAATGNPQLASSGSAIFLGALLDGIPESAAIGVGLATGQGVGLIMLIAVFLSNLPEGISGAVGMKETDRSYRYVMTVWGATVMMSGIAAALGYTFLGHASKDTIAATLALAAGTVLAMIADTMIPEAFEEGGRFVALVTVAGFLLAFVVSHLAG
ncbi:MAG: ZIP family zinc transporter [Proteobacteria bacterium]|nr:ZIP family zinc transporter [Pseudomonadota bacterium]